MEATQRCVYVVGRTGKAHREVVEYLKASKKVQDQMAGNLLDRVLRAREKADYYKAFPGNVKAATQAAIRDADRVLKPVVLESSAS